MKRIKIISCIVTAAMVLGLAAGCSTAKKVTTDSVEKACEALDYEELDIDDFQNGDLEASDIDDGFYVVIDADDIEDMEEENESVVSSTGLDDVLESDDIESAAIFMKGNGIEDFADDVDGLTDIEGVADCEFDLLIGIQATLTDDDKVDDIMDYVEDMLDEYDLDVDDPRLRDISSSTSHSKILVRSLWIMMILLISWSRQAAKTISKISSRRLRVMSVSHIRSTATSLSLSSVSRSTLSPSH